MPALLLPPPSSAQRVRQTLAALLVAGTPRGGTHPRIRGILAARWLSRADLQDQASRLRSPLVLRCIEDHLAGRRAPLDLLHADPGLYAPG